MATDNFTRANETPLASPWVTDSAFLKGLNLISNTAGNSASGDGCSYRNDSTVLFSQVTIVTVGASDGGPGVCWDGAGSGYLLNANSGSLIEVFKVTAGSFSSIATFGGVYTAGHTYSIQRVAGNIIAKDNGATIITIADSAFLTGRPCMHAFDATIRFDDWTDGAASAVVSSGPMPRQIWVNP